MRHRTQSATALAGWLLLTLTGCGITQPSASQPADGDVASPASPRTESRLVAVRAYSAGFSTEGQRTDDVSADVTLFDDGLVVADVSEFPDRRYVAVQLTRPEIDEYLSRIRALEVQDLSIPYDPAFHSTSLMTVIRIHDGTDDIEIAVASLLAQVAEPADVPQFAIEIDLLMSELKELAEAEGQPYSGDVPTVPGVLPEDPF